jgi:hypothetical protein
MKHQTFFTLSCLLSDVGIGINTLLVLKRGPECHTSSDRKKWVYFPLTSGLANTFFSHGRIGFLPFTNKKFCATHLIMKKNLKFLSPMWIYVHLGVSLLGVAGGIVGFVDGRPPVVLLGVFLGNIVGEILRETLASDRG